MPNTGFWKHHFARKWPHYKLRIAVLNVLGVVLMFGSVGRRAHDKTGVDPTQLLRSHGMTPTAGAQTVATGEIPAQTRHLETIWLTLGRIKSRQELNFFEF